LSINVLTGDWCDFARPEDRGGDPISVYAALFCNKNRVKAAREFGPLGITAKMLASVAAPRRRRS